MLAVSHTDAFCADTRRHNRHAVREGLQNFDPRAAAGAQRNHRYISPGVKRPQIIDVIVNLNNRVERKLAKRLGSAAANQIDLESARWLSGITQVTPRDPERMPHRDWHNSQTCPLAVTGASPRSAAGMRKHRRRGTRWALP